MDFCAGNQEIVHFVFFCGFGIGRGVCDGGAAASGNRINIVHDFAQIIPAEPAFKSDFRRFDMDGAHDYFVGQNRKWIHSDIRQSDC